tara:strand:+ start:2572 stop:2796 length:225 start_codon:yes stop_codon:yes gene_type:complete
MITLLKLDSDIAIARKYRNKKMSYQKTLPLISFGRELWRRVEICCRLQFIQRKSVSEDWKGWSFLHLVWIRFID